jgi:Fe-S oxidoreductase
VIVSSCPFCEVNLRDAVKELQNGMEVVDLMQMLAELL